MTFVIYSAQCTPCKYRVALDTIKSYINLHSDSLEIKNTAFSVANKKEAESIGQTLPFIYNADTKLSTQLLGVTHEQLDRTRGIQ